MPIKMQNKRPVECLNIQSVAYSDIRAIPVGGRLFRVATDGFLD